MEEIKPLPGRKNKGKQEGNENGYIYRHNSETAYCWRLQFQETEGLKGSAGGIDQEGPYSIS